MMNVSFIVPGGRKTGPRFWFRRLRSNIPDRRFLERLEHEYSLREELDREWAVRPLALNRHEGQVMLVLEDPSSAAVSLDRVFEARRHTPRRKRRR